jgi:hypothetical protein
MRDAVSEIQQLVLHERQARDRGWWRQMRAAYTTDATVAVSWFRGSADDFVGRSEQMATKGDQAVHRLAPPVIDIADARAVAEVPAAIELRIEIDGVQADLVSYARLLYQAVRLDDYWRLRSMVAVYERDSMVPVIPAADPVIDTARLAALRPSYRWLAYYLSQQGYPVGRDLPGDDRPVTVRAVYDETFRWLATSGPVPAAASKGAR